VFSGHFNILGAASLVFALEYLNANDFEKLVEKNKVLCQNLRNELANIGWIPEYQQRKPQSSIVSILTDEAVLNQLQEQGIRASYRGKYLRFSMHFYNSNEEIQKLITLLKQSITV
jgi:cysteine desulfurase/selenocysteine lyase